jgi:hypothetical protein
VGPNLALHHVVAALAAVSHDIGRGVAGRRIGPDWQDFGAPNARGIRLADATADDRVSPLSVPGERSRNR